MKRALWAIPVVIAVVLLFAYGFGKDPSVVGFAMLNRKAPDFTLKIADGNRTVSLAKLRGHPVVVNFFASWCVACKQQEANLVAAAKRSHTRARFLGVVFEDGSGPALRFTRSHGGSWPDLVDPNGTTAIAYGVTGIPETFFISRTGRIVFHTDSLAPADLRRGLRRRRRREVAVDSHPCRRSPGLGRSRRHPHRRGRTALGQAGIE